MDEKFKRDALYRFAARCRQLRAEMEGFNLAGGALDPHETLEQLAHVEAYLNAVLDEPRVEQ